MTQALFFYNGLMEKLQPYLDDGTLVCKSGQITFEETGILRWSMDEAQSRAEETSEVNFIQTQRHRILSVQDLTVRQKGY